MPFRRVGKVISLFAAVACLGLAACSDEDEEEEQQEEEHDPTSASCVEIMDVCHAADEGTGPAHDCHDVAHADVEADCAAQKDACITACAM